jgi:photosystem II stability/assembly factor-like uncharacterized protein
MVRTVPHAAAAAGLAVALTLACSETSAPSASFPRTTGQAPRGPAAPVLTPQVSGTSQRLQAVSPVSPQVVWASGLGGTYAVTTDGGEHWQAGVVHGAEQLQFRDVEGVSADIAYLLSAGTGSESRIYKTTDGGTHWKLQIQNQIPTAFFDCFDFWTPFRGIAFSDAVDGRFPTLRAVNGRTWIDIGRKLPKAQPGEAGFAASGTCIATLGDRQAWIATGGATQARILATTDGGESWNAYDTPIVQGTPGSGGFSVAFRDPDHGILVGGDLEAKDPPTNNVAVSQDGGKSWTLVRPTPFPGAAFGVAYAPGAGSQTVVATGPGGTAWSPDEGGSWQTLAGITTYWAVAFAGKDGWLVGTDGKILKISF